MVGVVAISGLVFGGTNVGVSLIRYLQSQNLSNWLFVGAVALVFLGLNSVRIDTAEAVGLYSNTSVLLGTVGARLAVFGVELGKRVRPNVRGSHRRAAMLELLTFIGIRLLATGFGLW